MPYRVALTWHEPRKCWKKYRDGKTYYVGKGSCRGKSDRDGYRHALAEWRAIERRLIVASPNLFGIPAGVDISCATQMTDWRSVGITRSESTPTAPHDRSIKGLIKEFLKVQESRADCGEIKLCSYRVYPITLADFREYCNAAGRTEVDSIDAMLLEAYRRDQRALVLRTDAERVTAYTVQQRLAKVRKFLQWCYKSGAIDCIPRNLDEEYARIALPKPNPKSYTDSEVKAIWVGASQRTKLYIALGLNCGYRQQDIASLRREHIDIAGRIIRRQRSKTGVQQPHRLWRVTSELLSREMAPKSSTLALLDEKGQCLRREFKRPDGGVTINDTIRLAYERVLKKLEMSEDDRKFAALRKTGATTLNRLFPREPHLVSQYLAHEDAATKRFYVEEFYERLFDALDVLEAHYGLIL